MGKRTNTFDRYYYKYEPSEEELDNFIQDQISKINRTTSNHTDILLASHLKEQRLWTDSAIKRFLPQTIEQIVGNKHQKGWYRKDVLEAESQEAFCSWFRERLINKYQMDALNGLKKFIASLEDLPHKFSLNKVAKLDAEFDLNALDLIELECELIISSYSVLSRPEFDRVGYPAYVMREVHKRQHELKNTPAPVHSLEREHAFTVMHSLRPTVSNPSKWNPDRPRQAEWRKIRHQVLERDNNTCYYCAHTAKKYMNVHHVGESSDNDLLNLVTCCVACHAVLHLGRNLSLGKVEVWSSPMSQVEIIKYTREKVRDGLSLQEIKGLLSLKEGKYSPNSIKYANDLIYRMGDESALELEEPMKAIFVDFVRWQVDENEQ